MSPAPSCRNEAPYSGRASARSLGGRSNATRQRADHAGDWSGENDVDAEEANDERDRPDEIFGVRTRDDEAVRGDAQKAHAGESENRRRYSDAPALTRGSGLAERGKTDQAGDKGVKWAGEPVHQLGAKAAGETGGRLIHR